MTESKRKRLEEALALARSVISPPEEKDILLGQMMQAAASEMAKTHDQVNGDIASTIRQEIRTAHPEMMASKIKEQTRATVLAIGMLAEMLEQKGIEQDIAQQLANKIRKMIEGTSGRSDMKLFCKLSPEQALAEGHDLYRDHVNVQEDTRDAVRKTVAPFFEDMGALVEEEYLAEQEEESRKGADTGSEEPTTTITEGGFKLSISEAPDEQTVAKDAGTDDTQEPAPSEGLLDELNDDPSYAIPEAPSVDDVDVEFATTDEEVNVESSTIPITTIDTVDEKGVDEHTKILYQGLLDAVAAMATKPNEETEKLMKASELLEKLQEAKQYLTSPQNLYRYLVSQTLIGELSEVDDTKGILEALLHKEPESPQA